MAETVKIGGELESTATGNVVAAASAIKDKVKNKYQGEINAETDASLADRYTKAETYNKTELNNMITTPNQEFVSVVATDQTTAVTDVLPATGEADTIYRVGNWDGTQYNDSVFSEYTWSGSAYIKLSTKSQVGEVYDISANHADTKYADLSAALGTNGANIPQSLRKGGMSVKFVQSSDNKYVQYRYLLVYADTTEGNAAFVNPNNWQGVDEEVIKNSHNLVESGGVDKAISQAKDDIQEGYDKISYERITPAYSIAERYYNFGNPINANYPYATEASYNASILQYTALKVLVPANTKFFIRGAGAANNYNRLYLITSVNSVTQVYAEARVYTRDEQSQIFQFNEDVAVFMNVISPLDETLDGVFKEVTSHIDGINEIVEELQGEISTISENVDTLTDSVNDLEEEIQGSEKIEYQRVIPTNQSQNGYYNFGNPVNENYSYNTSASHSSAITQYTSLRTLVPAGTKFFIRGYNDNYVPNCRLFLIASVNNETLAYAEARVYTRDEQSQIFQFNEDVAVFMNITSPLDETLDGVFKEVTVIKKGLEEKVENLEETVGGNPFKGKKMVTIGDSLSTGGIWQNKLCQIIGTVFDEESNIDPVHPLSVGGTSTYGTKKDMGLVRVRNLANLDFTPDIIMLENCNDKSAFYIDGGVPLPARCGEITDPAYIVQQVIDDVATASEWESNAAAILASIPSASRQFGTMLMITSTGNGINVKPTTLPSTSGTFTLNLSHGGQTYSYAITVEANESVSSIISKILEYDYQNVSDTLASDGESVDFYEEAGMALSITYNANGTGIVLSITNTSTAKSQNGVFFDGDSLSDWEDPTKWINIIPLYRAWKGVIEYCNIHYPNAKLYILGFLNRSGHTSSEFLNADGTYDQDAYKETQAREESLMTALKNLADMYSIPFVDVGHNDGINVANLATFYPGTNAHPYEVGYNRFGEVIASLMK